MLIHDTKAAGPVRSVRRTIDRRDDDSGFSSHVDDGVRSYSSGHNTIEEALRVIQGQTETLQICQLWDTVPGLQFRGQKEWAEALKAWKEGRRRADERYIDACEAQEFERVGIH